MAWILLYPNILSLAALPDLSYHSTSAARAADCPRKGFNPPCRSLPSTFYSSP
jgi:hypothetical protein